MPPPDRPAPGWYRLAEYAVARGFRVGPVAAARIAGSGAKHPGTLSRVARQLEADPRVRAAMAQARQAFDEAHAACLMRVRASLRG